MRLAVTFEVPDHNVAATMCRLRWAAGILKPIDKELRDYRMATAAKRVRLSLPKLSRMPAAAARNISS